MAQLQAAFKRNAMGVALVVAYVLAAKAGLTVAAAGTVSPVWPAEGVAIATLTLLGPGWFPAIVLGAWWAYASTGVPLAVAAGIASGEALAAIVGALILRRRAVTGEVTGVGDALVVMAVAPLAPLASAAAGVFSLSFAGLSAWSDFWAVWLVWWLGAAMGALFLTPLVLGWSGPPTRRQAPPRTLEALAMLVVVFLTTSFPFVQNSAWAWLGLERMPLILFIFPPLVWAALRLSPKWATLGLELMMSVAVWHTAHGRGPFSYSSELANMVILQLMMAAIGGTVLVLIGAIAERDRHADRLAEARDQADAANQAKTRFVADVGHDMRQPLQAARLFLDVLKPRQREANARTLVERTETSLGALGAALDALRDITAMECGQIRPDIAVFAVGELLEQLAAEYRLRAAEHGVEFRHVRCARMVRTDRQLLGRILRNLLSNAVRYTARGRIVLGCRRDPGGVRVEVCDSGPGIPADQLGIIFQAFHRAPEAERQAGPGEGGGLGLGLATVNRLATMLGLRVAVRSRVGRGSVFSVVVPAHPSIGRSGPTGA